MDKTRNTIQRQLIFNAVKELGCHASAEEIYSHVSKQYPAISKGTVYRNLNQLAEAGDVLRVAGLYGISHYDHNCHNHYHFVCEKCRKVFDVDMDYIPDIYEQIKNKNGFLFTSHDITFSGRCLECMSRT